MEMIKSNELFLAAIIVAIVVLSPLIVRLRENIVLISRKTFRKLFLTEEERKVIARTKKMDRILQIAKQITIYAAVVTAASGISYFVSKHFNKRK